MSLERALRIRSARVIVVANGKGGSGKSTVAMHVAVALMKSGHRVATVDLDGQQKSFSHYLENRRAWAEHVGRPLENPNHICIGEHVENSAADNSAAEIDAFLDAVDGFAESHDFIVIDTPGSRNHLTRIVHAMADTLVTPLNDSFIDFDVLGVVDPETFQVTDTSHYSKMVEDARRQRSVFNRAPADWIVLRNRLSMLGSRNKRLVGEGLQELAGRLGFRCIDGLGERVIFREFYPRGLTALDDVNEATLGTRPTLSHLTARQEVQALLDAMKLNVSINAIGQARTAA
jgi:chromosome partitioning protein